MLSILVGTIGYGKSSIQTQTRVANHYVVFSEQAYNLSCISVAHRIFGSSVIVKGNMLFSALRT